MTLNWKCLVEQMPLLDTQILCIVQVCTKPQISSVKMKIFQLVTIFLPQNYDNTYIMLQVLGRCSRNSQSKHF